MKQQTRRRWIAGAVLTAVMGGGAAWHIASASAEATGPGSVDIGTGNGLRKDCDPSLPANVRALWRFQPGSFSEVRTRASTIVLAKVVSAEQAPDHVTPSTREPGGVIRFPTQTVTLAVQRSYKGPLQPGYTFELTKNGSACFRVADDPAYQPGETHLLLLEPAASRQLRVVGPQGRYKQLADGRLQAVRRDPVTTMVEDKRVEAIMR